MGRRIVPVTRGTLPDLPQPCRSCAFWETGPGPIRATRGHGSDSTDGEPSRPDDSVLKEYWLTETLAGWGPCGYIAYVDDRPAGYVLYAPPAFVPRAAAFPMSPIGADAVLLTAARVLPEYRGAGLGRALVQTTAKDLTRRSVRAIEAYGDAAGSPERTGPQATSCRVPVGFLTAVGFGTVREHAHHPRLRLDLRAAVSWRDPVEGALERMRGAVRAFPAGANRV